MWTTLAIIINIMRIAKDCQSGWWSGDLGQPQGPITRVGWKGDKRYETNQGKLIVGLLPRPSELCHPKVYDPQTKFLQKKLFLVQNSFWSILDPILSILTLLNVKTPLLALVDEIFPPISSLCLHFLPSQMPGCHNLYYPARRISFSPSNGTCGIT